MNFFDGKLKPKADPAPAENPESLHAPIVAPVYACAIVGKRGRLASLTQRRHHQLFGPAMMTLGFYMSSDDSISILAATHFHN